MNNRQRTHVFVSHATVDGVLASLLKKAIRSSLGIPTNSIFVSSADSLKPGDDQFAVITETHRQADVILVLLTPASLLRPWVMFEAGGAHFYNPSNAHNRLIPVVAKGLHPGDLRDPLLQKFAVSLADRTALRRLCQAIAARIPKKLSVNTVPKTLSDRIMKNAGHHTEGYSLTSVTWVSQTVRDSPFTFDKLLLKATTAMWIAGPNLHHIASNAPTYKKNLFDWLGDSNKRSANILISLVMWGDFGGVKGEKHLRQSKAVFSGWLKEAREKGLRLRIRLAPVVRLGLIIVDPHRPYGQAIITPIITEPSSGSRFCFQIEKSRQPLVFGSLCSQFVELFEDEATEPLVWPATTPAN